MLMSSTGGDDVRVAGAGARGDEHTVDLCDPGVVVGGLFVRGGGTGIAVDLVEHEAGGIVLLLEEIEAGDAGFFGAGCGVDAGGCDEGVDELGFNVGVNDEDVHTPSII